MFKFGDFLKNLNPFSQKGFSTALINDDLPDVDMKKWSKTDFLKVNEISLYINRAIEKRAEKVGQTRFILKRADNVVENDPRLKVLYKPNKIHTAAKFWSLWQKYYDLTGSAYILKISDREIFQVKTVTELHLLRPDLVDVKFEDDGAIKGFEYQKPGGEKKLYLPEQIIYSFRPDPLYPLQGISLLAAGIRVIDLERQLSEYQIKVLKNGGKVEGVFKFKAPRLTETQIGELRKGYDKQIAEAKNAGKPLFLGGDADYTKLGLNPEELSYLESKRATLDDIVLMTGVPKAILGITSDETFSNADAAIRVFLRETIKPLLDNLKVDLDLGLFPEEDLDLDFIDPTPEDLDKKFKMLETANTINALTTNEKREILGGFDPVDGGDEVMVPFSLTPLNSTLDLGGDDQKSIKAAHPLKDPFLRERYGKLYLKKFDRREKGFLKKMEGYFRGQRERILEALKNRRQFRKKNLIDEIFSKAAEIKIAKEQFLPLLEEILREAGIDAMDLVGSGSRFFISDNIASWLHNKTEIFARSINETTFDQLQKEFTDSLAAGETRDQLIDRIQDTYGNISSVRATMIARTEVQGASQKGAFEGYKQAGMNIKIWVATQDQNTRDAHSEADGQERPIDMPFDIGGEALMFPGDPRGSAENVINCRCTI